MTAVREWWQVDQDQVDRAAEGSFASAGAVRRESTAEHERTAAGPPGEARDDHGRWTDDGSVAHDEAGGFRQLSPDETYQWAVTKAMANGRTRPQAEATARILYSPNSKGQMPFEVHVRADGAYVEFAAKARITDARKNDVLGAVGELRGLYPDRQPRTVSIASQTVAKALASDAIGMTVRGGGHIVLAPAALKPATLTAFKSGYEEGNSKFMPVGASTDVNLTRYTMYHEWGHTMDTPRGQDRPAGSQDALDNIPAGSAYGRTSQLNSPAGTKGRDGAEAFAESFAEWHLTRGTTQDPLARALANSEGWRKFRGG